LKRALRSALTTPSLSALRGRARSAYRSLVPAATRPESRCVY
jgi:hypothetical protein